MGKTKQNLWTKFGGKEFFARMAENAKNDGEGNEIAKTYATKDVATTTADGLLSKTDKQKLDGIATGAQVNTIESISANGTALTPDGNKNVDIPLATSQVDGLLPHGKFPLIPPAPDLADGPDQVYSFDENAEMSWQTIVKDYLGDMVLDQQGNPVTGEDGSPVFSEGSVRLWLSYKGTEFGARRAYDDHTGANIHDSIEARTTLAQVTAAIESALANYGGFQVVSLNSDVPPVPDVAEPSTRFIYLTREEPSTKEDPYTEWIWVEPDGGVAHWEKIGETSIDISNFASKVPNAEGNIPALDANGDLVDSGVAAASLTSKSAADGGTDLSLVTTGEKYVWNNTRQLPDPTGHVNGAVLSLMSSTVQWDGDGQDDFVTFNFPEGVEIPRTGGDYYNAIQIGNLIWMTSNMACAPSGLSRSYYMEYSDQSHTEWGYRYNTEAIRYLLTNTDWLPIGWRIPKQEDFNALYLAASGQGLDLKAETGWYTNSRQDPYGFHADPSGEWSLSPWGGSSMGWYHTGSNDSDGKATYWTQTVSNRGYYIAKLTNGGTFTTNSSTSWACIRLVKDAPVED